jgi:hypothetical protein
MIVRVLIVMTVALAVAACGSTAKRAAKPATTATPAVHACKLTTAQKHAVSLAMADIRRLKKIQAPLHKYSDTGTPAQETVTGKFLLDMGRGNLPIDLRGHLIDLAKSSVGLCGQCFQGLEAAEPAVEGSRFGGKSCG